MSARGPDHSAWGPRVRRALALAAALLLGCAVALIAARGAPAQSTPTTTATTGTTTGATTTGATTTGATTTVPAPYPATAPTNGALDRDGQDERYLLGGEWLYQADLSNVGVADGWWRDVASTAGWTPVTIPNSYNAGNFSSSSEAGYVGWYRRDFLVPTGAFSSYVPAADRRWIIEFESVNYTATVWLNGHELGTHEGAYLPFEFDLKYLKAGVNRLVVRVDNQRTPGDFPPGPDGLWWNFGGLLDVVYLRPVQRADIDQVQVRPLLPCPTCAATIDEQAIIRNVTGQPQSVRLTGTYGAKAMSFGSAKIAPGASWTANASVVVPHPRLWAPGSPTLYRATLTLRDTKGRYLGGYTTYSGVRSITVTADGRLELNGRLLNLRGVNLHEQSFGTGAALDMFQMRRLIGWVKDLGATIIRAHYPLNPELEEMADRDGILLWSEVPVYQVQNQYLGQPSWRARALALLKDNIETNQNHPSILLWSIGNELPTPPSSAEAGYIAAAAGLAHQLDPTRPVGMAISDWPGVACQAAYAPLDVIGVNEYFGWFDAGGGTTDDRAALGPFLDSVRACYPRQALMVTEFGFDANTSGPVEVRGTYAFQTNSIQYHLGVFATKPWLSGAIYFALQDFAAKPGWDGGNPLGTPPFVTKGLVDRYGNLKQSFPVVASIYHATTQIAPTLGPRRRLSSAARAGPS